MPSIIEQDIFELTCILRDIDIKLCAKCENGVKLLLAIVTRENEVVLFYTYGELAPILKRIPWFTDGHKQIEAICFDPSASWLLAVSLDGSVYIIPALNLVDKKQKIDCKWSLVDVTHFPKHPQTAESKPTSCVWWQTLDCNQNALIGFENGAIVLISLTDGRCLGSCSITEKVKQLYLCQDNSLDTVSLLINGESGQQWRLILEHHSTGYLWPPDEAAQVDDTTKSRLYNLKQLGMDKLVSLKQRLTESRGQQSRGNRRDSQNSDTASDTSHSEQINSAQSGPELLPHLCDTFFAPQYARNRYLFSAFYKPTSLLTVHAVNVDSAPLYVHKLCPKTKMLLFTDKVIYTVGEDNKVSAISAILSECRLEGDAEFNEESLLAQFLIENETILNIFKLSDMSIMILTGMTKENELCKVQLPKVDTCVIVTDKAIYKIKLRCSPIIKFAQYVVDENNMEKAEKLSCIFDLNQQHLLECCGDLLISRGAYHSAILVYKRAKVHLLKRVLKLAVAADCGTLLKFVHLCLSASKVDMSVVTNIHIGNLAVMAYTELILRYGGETRMRNTNDFMEFLCYEEHYDQVLAVNVACQAGHWNIVTLLAKCRGLQTEVVTALGQILQSGRAPRPLDEEFLFALSEPSLTQSMTTLPESTQAILNYIRTNIESFPVDILKRFAMQLDPSQPCAIPIVSHIIDSMDYSTSFDSTTESVDIDESEWTRTPVKEWIETFLNVVILLVAKTSEKSDFDLKLLEGVDGPIRKSEVVKLARLPELNILSCASEHAAVIRNNCVYTMGVPNCGSLGLGPLLTQGCPPKLVETLSDLKVKALSVSCGKKHTLCLTDYGVYAWGSNTYGQLGLGPCLQESPYPQLVNALSFYKIVEIVAGQYHSVALTSSGQVYTWGWGIHGQLGHGSCDNETYPKLLNFGQPVKQVTAGHAHTLILTCDGKIFGFGSNVFGQLETCHVDSNKSTRPVRVFLMTDMHSPIEKISTAYFHNIAVKADQEVYIWGASPQEIKIFQSKVNQKQSDIPAAKATENWKDCVYVYSAMNKKPIEQVSVGYRHCAILHDGNILWGKNKGEELSSPKLRDQDNINSFFAQRFTNVSCGVDYTMAFDHTGKLLAWGTPTMAQTILGRSSEHESKKLEGKLLLLKNTKRIIKFPNSNQTNENFPIEIPGLPTMEITFNPPDHSLIFSQNSVPYSVLLIENNPPLINHPCGYNPRKNFEHINHVPSVKFGPKTLHYVLGGFYGYYDAEKVQKMCVDAKNFQAASKIALLDGHFGDSLALQLLAFKKHMESLGVNLHSLFTCKDSYDLKEKEEAVEFIINDAKNEHSEKNSTCNSPAHVLSSSSSLDSIRQWGDEGGRESPCDLGDIRQNITQYVQAITNSGSPPISSVSKMVSEIGNAKAKINSPQQDLEVKDKTAKEIIDSASYLVEFYIRKVYLSENHILMQNILLKCIEFWLSNNLPVCALEGILLKNLDKYFYPLSILLFCKNFESNDEEIVKDQFSSVNTSSSGFLKEFSTKFCLQLCSMVLENVNKS